MLKKLLRGEKLVSYTYRRVSTKRYKYEVFLWKWTITINCHKKEYQLVLIDERTSNIEPTRISLRS